MESTDGTSSLDLATGIIPAGGIGSAQSVKRMGYKSPNEKLNLAAIGGGQAFNDAEAGVENVVAIADVDFTRGSQASPKAEMYKDFREMLDKQKDGEGAQDGVPAVACS